MAAGNMAEGREERMVVKCRYSQCEGEWDMGIVGMEMSSQVKFGY